MLHAHHQEGRDAHFKNEHQRERNDSAIPTPHHRTGTRGRTRGGFAGSVHAITRERGPMPFAALEGQTVTFMTHDDWTTGKVLRGGVRAVEEVILVPAMRNARGVAGWHKLRSNLSYNVVVAMGQAWPGTAGQALGELAVGAVIPSACHPEVRHLNTYGEGFRHGLIFADGNLSYSCRNGGGKVYRIRLCGPKAVHARLFSRTTSPPSTKGDPVASCCSELNLKDFPQAGQSPEYLAGFLAGWLAGDGHQLAHGRVRLYSQHLGALRWLQAHAPLAGWILTGYSAESRMTTNLGTRKNPLVLLTLTRHVSSISWMVKAVHPADRREPVFVVVTNRGEDITLAGGISAATLAATGL